MYSNIVDFLFFHAREDHCWNIKIYNLSRTAHVHIHKSSIIHGELRDELQREDLI